MINDFNIGEKLKNLRLKHNLQIKQMAERLDLPPTTYANYEKNLRDPKIITLSKVAQEFNVSLDELCGVEREIKTEMNISNVIGLIYNLVLANKVHPYQERDHNGNIVLECGLFTNDKLLYKFFDELDEMVRLYKNNTIKKSLFDLWIEDKKREYTEKEIEKNKEQETKEQDTEEN